MYKLSVYVPQSHLETLKAALFAAGGGRQGDYDQCCWQCLGQGQFRPLAGSQPYLGQEGQLERVSEWKLEMLVAAEQAQAVVAALQAHHPYQVPAFDLYALAEVFSPDEA